MGTLDKKTKIKKSVFDVLKIIYWEHFSKNKVLRRPEPTMTMDEESQVAAYDEAGALGEGFRSAYFFNVQALSRLVPLNGTLLDLACGSGQFLFEFKKARPDVKIIAVDLSDEMLKLARDNGSKKGLDIEWIKADITSYFPDVKIDCVSCVFALHHLPQQELLRKTVENLKAIVDKMQCNFWIFDLTRPQSERTIDLYPMAFSDGAKEEFNLDSQNSLRAAFSFNELNVEFKEAFGEEVKAKASTIIPLYQCYFRANVKNKIEIKIDMTKNEAFNTNFVRLMFRKAVKQLSI